MRRAIRHGHRLGIRGRSCTRSRSRSCDCMGDAVPGARERRKELIASVAEQEEVRFRETIERGLKILDEEIATMRAAGKTSSSRRRRRSSSTTRTASRSTSPRSSRASAASRSTRRATTRRSTSSAQRSEGSKVGEEAIEHVWRDVLERRAGSRRRREVHRLRARGRRGARSSRIVEGRRSSSIARREGEEAVDRHRRDAVLRRSRAGRSATRRHRGARHRADATSTSTTRRSRSPGSSRTSGKVAKGAVAVGDAVHLEVDHARRTATRRNHSATHLLHWALRTVLGEQAHAEGLARRARIGCASTSRTARRSRRDEIAAIEDLVNDKVLTDAPVLTEVLPIDEARKRGAMAIFEEKYGDVVRVLTMTKDSVELCGGTHARALGEIGLFKIVSERRLAAGVRRIEAATGLNALALRARRRSDARGSARALGEIGAGASRREDREARRGPRAARERDRGAEAQGRRWAGEPAAAAASTSIDRARGEIPGGKALAVQAPSRRRRDAARDRRKAARQARRVGRRSSARPGTDKAMLVADRVEGRSPTVQGGRLDPGHRADGRRNGGGRPDMAQAGGTESRSSTKRWKALPARWLTAYARVVGAPTSTPARAGCSGSSTPSASFPCSASSTRRRARPCKATAALITTLGFLLIAGTILRGARRDPRDPALDRLPARGCVRGAARLRVIDVVTVKRLAPVNTLALALIALAGGVELRWEQIKQGCARSWYRDGDSLALRDAPLLARLLLAASVHPVRARPLDDPARRGLAFMGRVRGESQPVGDPRDPLADARARRGRPIRARVRHELGRRRDLAHGLRDHHRAADARAGRAVLLDAFRALGHEVLGSVAIGTTLGLLLVAYLRIVGRSSSSSSSRSVSARRRCSSIFASIRCSRSSSQASSSRPVLARLDRSSARSRTWARRLRRLLRKRRRGPRMPLLVALWPVALLLAVSRAGVTFGAARVSSSSQRTRPSCAAGRGRV